MDIVQFANSFQHSSTLELDGIKCLLKKLNNPEKKLKYIHVAGTNGKGSVCAFLEAILTHAGYKCGKFTSPFMRSPEERIAVNGKSIPTKTFEALVRGMEKLADGQSQFEIWTCAAFLYFLQEQCDIVILECGMGGKGDATNVIPAPLCAVITTIGLDHTAYLGSTIQEIAENKCGIIKPGTQYTITCNQPAAAVINAHAQGEWIVAAPETQYPLSLKGSYQPQNAGIAVAVCRALRIEEAHIAYGLSHAKHPGRFEIFRTTPPIIFDGAHNPNGAEALCESLPTGELNLVCAFMADKDIRAVFEVLKAHNLHRRCTLFCTTVPQNPRAATPEHIESIAASCGFSAKAVPTVLEALQNCTKQTVVFGSLYLYKPFYEAVHFLYPNL